jgi:hypothetical protein
VGGEGYRLATTYQSYAFDAHAVLGPGESMRIEAGGDPADDTRLVRHWGYSRPVLIDGGDVAKVSTYDDIVVACTAWGDARC